jgi:hypothetical protein
VGKVRPVVVLDDEASAIIVAKVTTAQPHDRYTYCELADWESEGPLRPSRIQVTPLFRLGDNDILRDSPLGVLAERDRAALQNALDAAAEERGNHEPRRKDP